MYLQFQFRLTVLVSLPPECTGDVIMLLTDWLATGVADVEPVAHECTFSDDLISPFALPYCRVLRRIFLRL